ncbi:hypothetical protein DRE_06594 [Drechslerella stenobrocha 248]|uniref:Uncharacterized protein n=1 Tax=Drechslerella stenobrocha 248 TaxID=1043628 RepID=W7HXQ3_9PEZI|nr:hypothetical protein DRE_06594 [Drechslerella stenobrocha 248]
MSASEIIIARKAALVRFLRAAAGLASSFESAKQAASTLNQWLDQDQVVSELASFLPAGNDVSGHSDDPIVKVLDIVMSIIPAAPGGPVDNESAVEKAQESTLQRSSRWADWDDEVEDDWVPDILQQALPQATTSSKPTYEEASEPAAGIGRTLSRCTSSVTDLTEAGEGETQPTEDDSSDYVGASDCPRAGEVQDPEFQGYWIDDCGKFQCYVGGEGLFDGEELVKEGYFWDRHPFTPAMSAYERMTLAYNSVSFGTPTELRRYRGIPRNMAIPSGGLLDMVSTGERMRAKIGVVAASVGAQEASQCDRGSTPISTERAEAPTGTKNKDEVSTGAINKYRTPTDTTKENETASTIKEDAHHQVGEAVDLTNSSLNTFLTTPREMPISTSTARTSTLEFLISRGLHRDGPGTSPPKPEPTAKRPTRKRIRDVGLSWVAKWRSPGKSLKAACRRALARAEPDSGGARKR